MNQIDYFQNRSILNRLTPVLNGAKLSYLEMQVLGKKIHNIFTAFYSQKKNIFTTFKKKKNNNNNSISVQLRFILLKMVFL